MKLATKNKFKCNFNFSYVKFYCLQKIIYTFNKVDDFLKYIRQAMV